ncbi:4315_t:CDS:2, partial [Cetraspora pellucida]
MSSSGPKDQTKILIDNTDTPHSGKEISKYVFSPNMQYIVTWSEADKSIVGWTITNEPSAEPINSLNIDALNIDNLKQIDLLGASDWQNHVGYFAVIDITTKSRQKLSARGLKDNKLNRLGEDIAFLENGDLVITKKFPVYRAYIFTKSMLNGKYKWVCKNSIELEKYWKCQINKNGTLFMEFMTPKGITQWNLVTLKLEMQYITNLYLSSNSNYSLFLEMNSDKTLLAAAFDTKDYDKIAVYVYSTKTGMEVAK